MTSSYTNDCPSKKKSICELPGWPSTGLSFPSKFFSIDCKNCSRVGLRDRTLLFTRMIPARKARTMIMIQTILFFFGRMDIVLIKFSGDLGGHQGADIDRIRVIFDRIHLPFRSEEHTSE